MKCAETAFRLRKKWLKAKTDTAKPYILQGIHWELIKMLISKLKKEMQENDISIYKLSKLTGIKYELLRRVFVGQRKLSAEELLLILDKTSIEFSNIK